MSVKFNLYTVPNLNSVKNEQRTIGRVISKGTKQLDEICEHINETSSLNSADIKGALEALFKYVSTSLSRGYNVELDGLGHFSLSLKSNEYTDEQTGKTKVHLSINGVNFKCSKRMQKQIMQSRLERNKPKVSVSFSIEKRKERMLNFLQSESYINIMQYALLNACSRYRAKIDLESFEQKSIIRKTGHSTRAFYMIKQ